MAGKGSERGRQAGWQADSGQAQTEKRGQLWQRQWQTRSQSGSKQAAASGVALGFYP